MTGASIARGVDMMTSQEDIPERPWRTPTPPSRGTAGQLATRASSTAGGANMLRGWRNSCAGRSLSSV
jgi:hypothetical protein